MSGGESAARLLRVGRMCGGVGRSHYENIFLGGKGSGAIAKRNNEEKLVIVDYRQDRNIYGNTALTNGR